MLGNQSQPWVVYTQGWFVSFCADPAPAFGRPAISKPQTAVA